MGNLSRINIYCNSDTQGVFVNGKVVTSKSVARASPGINGERNTKSSIEMRGRAKKKKKRHRIIIFSISEIFSVLYDRSKRQGLPFLIIFFMRVYFV